MASKKELNIHLASLRDRYFWDTYSGANSSRYSLEIRKLTRFGYVTGYVLLIDNNGVWAAFTPMASGTDWSTNVEGTCSFKSIDELVSVEGMKLQQILDGRKPSGAKVKGTTIIVAQKDIYNNVVSVVRLLGYEIK